MKPIHWEADAKTYKAYWFDSMIPNVQEQTCEWMGTDLVCKGRQSRPG
jgi:hypothetical protein